MNFCRALAFALFFISAPAWAERLQFDHRLYPPLKQVLDEGDADMVLFDNSKPARLVDLIAVKGKSARNWTEALEIVATLPPKEASGGARGWMCYACGQESSRHSVQRTHPPCECHQPETSLPRLPAASLDPA